MRVALYVCHVVAALVHVVLHVEGIALSLVKGLVGLVAHLAQRVEQAADLQCPGEHQVAFALLVQDVLDVAGARFVLRRNHLVQLVYHAVDDGDVAVAGVHSTHLVDEDGVVLGDGCRQLMVVYVG